MPPRGGSTHRVAEGVYTFRYTEDKAGDTAPPTGGASEHVSEGVDSTSESEDKGVDRSPEDYTKPVKQQTISSWLKSGKMQEVKTTEKPAATSRNLRKSLNRRERTFLDRWLSASTNENTGEKPTDRDVQGTTGKKKPEPLLLTEDWKQSITKLIETGDREDVLCQHHLVIRKRDMRSLLWSNWLNDSIMDEYLLKIKKRSEDRDEYPSIEVLTVYFYKKLHRLGLEEGMNQTRDWIPSDLRDKELIFFPIHISSHWSMVYVDMKGKTINYLNSLEGSRNYSEAPGVIKRFMEKYHREKGEEVTYRVKIRTDAPLQENGVDCGVFALKCSDRISSKESLNFHQRDIPETRWKMAWEILNGELRDDLRVTAPTVQGSKKRKPAKKRERRREKKSQRGQENAEAGVNSNSTNKKQRINWPQANSNEWEKLDTDLTGILSGIGGSAEAKAESHPKVIYEICLGRFGAVTKKSKGAPRGPSRRQERGKSLREEINKLKKTYIAAPEEEKGAIDHLQKEKLKELRVLKRAESMRKSRGKMKANCQEFLGQPFKYGKKVLDAGVKGELKSSKEEVEAYLKAAHDDPKREEDLPVPDDLYEYPEAKTNFNTKEPTWREFSKLLRKTRTGSAPGPNGVPYRVYKKCPGVAKLLWLYLRGLWKKEVLSDTWRTAEGVFIPKENGATDVSKFRTINLLNVEGKIYFAILAGRLTDFTVGNGYIDTSIQKGGIPGISGCLEHTAILSQLIREAKLNKMDLVVSWLDIANAYGSIPHKLLETALIRAHVPEGIRKLIHSYYDNVSIRFTTKEFTTEFQKIEKGIITGCTLSVILFALTMTMLVSSVKGETKGPKTESGQLQEHTRLFMDDLATTTRTVTQTNHLLNALEDKMQWARLQVKPGKCRCLVIKKGAVMAQRVKIRETEIASVTEKPIKYLGKEYNPSLNDRSQVEDTIVGVKEKLRKVDRDKLPGRYKAWILQHILLPRVMWPLTIYSIPATKVEKVQQLFTASLKKWLGIPKSLSTDVLYSRTGKLQLPFSAVTEEVKAAKARTLVTYQQSSDDCVRNANINIDVGKKWNFSKEVGEAKLRLRLQEIAGIGNIGRQGLGVEHRQYYSKSTEKEKRSLIVTKVREKEEEARLARIAGLSKQSASFSWQVLERKITHSDIMNSSDLSLRFLIKSVYDLLPTPANKNKWFKTEEHKCKVCGDHATIGHILSGCPIALAQGRYTWRHNNVLRVIAHHIEGKRKEANKGKPNRTRVDINFRKPGEPIRKAPAVQNTSYFDAATDWVMKVDDINGTRLRIPPHIMHTDQRPDIIFTSENTKQMGIVELTVGAEENIEVNHERKLTNYAIIEETAGRRGWRVTIWAVEVGCRGFPAPSLNTCYKDLGFSGSQRRSMMQKAGKEAELASSYIWKWSHMKKWGRDTS